MQARLVAQVKNMGDDDVQALVHPALLRNRAFEEFQRSRHASCMPRQDARRIELNSA